MKKIFKYILLFAGASVLAAACTRNFEEMNRDPFGADAVSYTHLTLPTMAVV